MKSRTNLISLLYKVNFQYNYELEDLVSYTRIAFMYQNYSLAKFTPDTKYQLKYLRKYYMFHIVLCCRYHTLSERK